MANCLRTGWKHILAALLIFDAPDTHEKGLREGKEEGGRLWDMSRMDVLCRQVKTAAVRRIC